MLTELYIPGDSPLHSARPAWKLAALFAFCSTVFIVAHPLTLVIALVLAAVGYMMAGLNASHAFAAIRPALFVLAIIFAVQIWLADLGTATYVTLRFVALLAAAGLVTYTTTASAFTDGILALLSKAPAWVPRDKIALAMSLVWRFIPMIRSQFEEVREAQRARGLDRNMVALLVPLIVRILKNADEIAEAIEARSLD
ncbi:energy-coupling factor transporter transmembrane component T family protein [Celeribacter litoreus]|uniref:energy-coupling factor transporter transmembrane component T family protein n=1 Tax=Celeribacter litoreus TaxID=2876714 RepID=UPI001CCB8D14|nr:energy-coupling factor transporter transmembrane protein EcfT [Celeribacter litoreus]MCA0042892.1 energy-coupling factor transporter transmembrane protein EcfT [Celeribacter litoreus]